MMIDEMNYDDIDDGKILYTYIYLLQGYLIISV